MSVTLEEQKTLIKSQTEVNTAKANFWSSLACLVDEVSCLVTSFRIEFEAKAKKK